MNKIDCTCLALVALALVVAYVIFQNTPIVPALQGCQASAKRTTMSSNDDDPDVQNYTDEYNASTITPQNSRIASGQKKNAELSDLDEVDTDEEKKNKGKGVQSKEVKDEKAKAKTGGYVESTGRGKRGKNTDLVSTVLQSGKGRKYTPEAQERVNEFLQSDVAI